MRWQLCKVSAMFEAALHGYLVSLSLILAIGAQNAFVLRQGLRREHVGLVVLACAISDAILIAAGVSGFGAVSVMVPESAFGAQPCREIGERVSLSWDPADVHPLAV